jgi:hypothetical protein
LLEGSVKEIFWEAGRLAILLRPIDAQAVSSKRALRLPRIAVYAGQGIPRTEWGEIAWSLDEAGFPYVLLGEGGSSLGEKLGRFDTLVVPNGSAPEIVEGWDPEASYRKPPWQPAEPQRGIGKAGLQAIQGFVRQGGTYIGLGGGGAFLAGKDFLGLTRAEMLPSSVGLGQVRLRAVRPESPILFGYSTEEPIPAFFYAPPGAPDRGFAFGRDSAAVALYAGARDYPPERSFVSTEVLSSESANAAIIEEPYGNGRVVLFGIAPTFRGQWRSTFLLFYNALYRSADRSADEAHPAK